MRFIPTLLTLLVLVIGASPLASHEAAAQAPSPRFGIGFNSMLSTADGIGVGFRGRASAPVNSDLSIAIDLGFTGFLLGGRRNADYIFDPQLSAIISLPSTPDRLRYVLFGMGGYIPVGNDGEDEQNGPTVHVGIGWVHALQETSLYYEVNPALIVGEDNIDLAIPVRIGVIF